MVAPQARSVDATPDRSRPAIARRQADGPFFARSAPTGPAGVAPIGEYTPPGEAYRDSYESPGRTGSGERKAAMSLEHPWIDFDGDGHADNYDTVADDHGHYAFVHHDSHGHVDAIAYDNNHDGKIDEMIVDHDHDGTMDTHLTDTNHDGYMDHSSPYGTDTHQPVEHPHIDFDGDGHNDSYYSFNDGYGNTDFVHSDGHGHVDAIAQDSNHDGLIDREYVDHNHDGRLDHVLTDTNGDGYMDTNNKL
jgi:hypothetical protein